MKNKEMPLNERYLRRLTVDKFLDKFSHDSSSLIRVNDSDYEDDGYFPYRCRTSILPGPTYTIVVFTTELIKIETLATLSDIDPKLIAGAFAYGYESPLKVPEIIIIDELALSMDDLFAA